MPLHRASRRVALGLTLLAACHGLLALGASAGPAKGNPAQGKKIYGSRCIACHRPDGSGGVKLTGNPTPNWRDAKRMETVTDDQLRDCIVNGRPKSGMTAWGRTRQLKPADIEHLITYIRTFSAPK